jgi:hypothetical protein
MLCEGGSPTAGYGASGLLPDLSEFKTLFNKSTRTIRTPAERVRDDLRCEESALMCQTTRRKMPQGRNLHILSFFSPFYIREPTLT